MRDPWQQRLSDVMDERGVSGGELARKTGFTPQYINSLKSKERGGRLPLETAQKLAHALGVCLDWLTRGEGPKEPPRQSDVFPVYTGQDDRYPTRGEVVALLSTRAAPEVIAALKAVVTKGDVDPGRDFWIDYARDLAKALRRIEADPVLSRGKR